MRKHVWKLHGVDDTWMTPSSSNPRSPHTVKLSSSGRVSCDKDCPGYNAYFICAHTVAVADKAGTLTDFVKWHQKEKGGTNLTALADVGMPSSSGKKSTTSSKRKGAANKKPSNAPTVSSRLTCRETSTHPKPSRHRSCVWVICHSKHEISGQQSLGLLWLCSDTQARRKDPGRTWRFGDCGDYEEKILERRGGDDVFSDV